jgi:uncharacterized membrane protein YdjX (TVP38/TMEM64 family)
MKKKIVKLFILMFVALIFAGFFEHLHLYTYLSLDSFNRYHNQILYFEQQHMLEFTLVYILSYIVLIACCVPGTIVFDLIAGFIYGPFIGTFLVLSCYLLGAILNFSLVKLLFKDLFKRRFGHLQHLVLHERGIRATAINLIGLRFIPVIPFWLLNVLAAVLGIPFWIFVGTTFLGIIPTSIIYVLIGHGVRDHLRENQPITMAMLTEPKLWVPLVLLALLILIPNIVRSIRKKIKASPPVVTKDK